MIGEKGLVKKIPSHLASQTTAYVLIIPISMLVNQ